MTRNADMDKYGYSGYGIVFDRKSSFSFPGGGFGQNLLIFGVDISLGILVMELDLIENQVFHFQVVDLVKIY